MRGSSNESAGTRQRSAQAGRHWCPGLRLFPSGAPRPGTSNTISSPPLTPWDPGLPLRFFPIPSTATPLAPRHATAAATTSNQLLVSSPTLFTDSKILVAVAVGFVFPLPTPYWLQASTPESSSQHPPAAMVEHLSLLLRPSMGHPRSLAARNQVHDGSGVDGIVVGTYRMPSVRIRS